MIILEGSDGSGKTTFLKTIQNAGLGSSFVAYKPKNIFGLNFYINATSIYQNEIIDRYYLSELVYSKLKNRNNYTLIDQHIVESAILPYNPVIIYFDTPRDLIKEVIKKRGDDYVDLSEIDELIDNYEYYINNSIIPIFKYNYLKDNPINFIKKIRTNQNHIYSLSSLLKSYLGSGSLQTNNIMIVQNELSQEEINNVNLRPFSNFNSKTLNLFKKLEKYGYFKNNKIPYFTTFRKNFKDEEDSYKLLQNEISFLKPKVILVTDEILLDKINNSKLLNDKTLKETLYIINKQ